MRSEHGLTLGLQRLTLYPYRGGGGGVTGVPPTPSPYKNETTRGGGDTWGSPEFQDHTRPLVARHVGGRLEMPQGPENDKLA